MAVAFRLLDPEKGGFCGTLEIRSWSQEMIIVIVCVRVCVCVNAYLYACAYVCVRAIQLGTFTTGCVPLYSAGAVGMSGCRTVERAMLRHRMHGS